MTSADAATGPGTAVGPEAPARPSWAIATIVAQNYLPAARTLVDSIEASNPYVPVAVLVVDGPSDLSEIRAYLGTRVTVLSPADLPLDPREFAQMASIYDVTELSTSLKPWLLERLLSDYSTAIYLDPDIQVFESMHNVADAAAEHGIALTPHNLEPIPRDGWEPTDVQIMAAGVFNLGFIAVSRAGTDLLSFWQERLRRDSIVAPAQNLFTDQRWIDNVPALFPHIVLRDEALNVAYWNVFQREFALDARGRPMVHGQPVIFFHFSGYAADAPWQVSRHFSTNPRVLFSANLDLKRLCDRYGAALKAAGARAGQMARRPYGWSTAPDGTVLSPGLRRYLRTALIAAEDAGAPPPPVPFGAGGMLAFHDWLRGYPDPRAERANVNRAMHMAWLTRPDVQRAYPDVFGVDAAGFHTWCQISGVGHELLPEWLAAPRDDAPVAPVDALGAIVVGYLTSELGVGQIGRIVVDALRENAIPVSTRIESTPNRAGHPFLAEDSAPTHPIAIFSMNADQIGDGMRRYSPLIQDRYRIGVWAWELEEFPGRWDAAFALCDEIWAISEFTAKALTNRGFGTPIHTLPVSVPYRPERPDSTTRTVTRADFGVPESGPLFLFSFDYNSVFERKNPLGLIEAFRRAFPDGTEAHLLIKTINGARRPEAEQLRLAAACGPGITVYEGYLSPESMGDLYEVADCYVSLHRSEGFGLTVAEAMAAGVPVITSDYSAVAEFTSSTTALLVPGTMIDVGLGAEPYDSDAQWFEPDLDRAASHMRDIAGDLDRARRLGRAGRDHVRATRDPAITAQWVQQRVTSAYRTWQTRTTDSPAQPASSATALEIARQRLREPVSVTEDHRIPLAPVLRRATLRVLDHYDRLQRRRLEAVITAIGEQQDSVSELRAAVHAQHADRKHQIAAIEAAQSRFAIAMSTQTTATEALEMGATALGIADQDLRTEVASLHAAARVADQQREVLESARVQDRHDIETTLRQHAQRLDAADHGLAAHEAVLGTHAQESVELLKRLNELALLEARTGAKLATVTSAITAQAVAPEDETAAVATVIGPLLLPVGDTVILPWLREYGAWEVQESALVARLLHAGATLLDIGAHVGYYTVIGLRRVGAAGRVIAVEPDPVLQRLLAANVRANIPTALRDGLTILPVAAWDHDDALVLTYAQDGNTGDNQVTDDPLASGYRVAGRALDGLEDLTRSRIDVIKVDIQGRDHRALAGLRAIIERDRPHIVTEFWPEGICSIGDDPEQVLKMYDDWGYGLSTIAGDATDPASLLNAARESGTGFVSLWLKAPAAQ